MKKILLVTIILLCHNILLAQRFDWATSGGSVNGTGHVGGAIDIARDSIGNYYVLDYGSAAPHQCQGDTLAPFNNQTANAFIYKFDRNGNILFMSRIGSMAPGTSFTPLAIECDENGNFFVLGHPNGGNQMSAGSQNLIIEPHKSIIVKFDNAGVYQWFYQTNFSNASTLLKYHNGKLYFQYSNLTINCIAATDKTLLNTLTISNFNAHPAYSGPSFRSAEVMSNNDIVFTGLAYGDIHYGTKSAFLPNKGYWLNAVVMLKTNENLNVDWIKYPYYTHNPYRAILAIAIDHDDNIYIGGNLADTAIFGNDTIFNYSSHYNGSGAIMKFDKDGNGKWGKFLQTTDITLVYAMTQTNDQSGIYIGGSLQGMAFLDNITISNTTNLTIPLAYLAKIDYDGNFIKAFIPTPKPLQNDVYSLIPDGDNGYVFGGKHENSDTMFLQCINPPKNRGFYIAHFLDMDTAIPTPTIQANGNILTATPTFNGGIQWYLNNNPIPGAIGATFTASTAGNYTVQYKIETGCPDSAMSAAYLYQPTDIENISSTDAFEIYPNPTQDIIHINNKTNKTIHVSLLNALGQSVLKTIAHDSKIKIDVSRMQAGIYIVQINTNQSNYQYKLIIQ